MCPGAIRPGSANSAQADDGSDSDSPLDQLLRYSHIFASAVREVLDARLLADVSAIPLTVSQFHLLKLMTLNGQHHVGEAADFLGVSPPAATQNIDKLERLGLVTRSPCPADRRATLISVSPKGRRLVKKHGEVETTRIKKALESFQREEIELLAHLLERLAVSLLDQDQSGDGLCLRCAAHLQANCPVGHVSRGCPYNKLRKARPSEGGKKEKR